jgi:methylated-DNA-protein-cysteine methyltransferase-like protein
MARRSKSKNASTTSSTTDARRGPSAAVGAGSPAEDYRVLRPGFNQRVYALVRQVPLGALTTYGDIAKTLGAVQVARHVGNALAALRDADHAGREGPVPWQRVVNSRGRISFPVGSEAFERQRLALEAEGVHVEADGRVPLTPRRFSFELS